MTRFLQMALGSASELEYQFLLARDLQLLSGADYGHLEREVVEVKKMLTSLIQRLKSQRFELMADS